MLREVALRRAIEDARAHRARELEGVVGRQGARRRRLRELQDRLLALGTVHERFAKPEDLAATAASLSTTSSPSTTATPSMTATPTAPVPPREEAPPVESMVVRTPSDIRLILAPPKRDAEAYAPLLDSLVLRRPEGFTVSQMRDVMDFAEPERAHSYDAAVSLANTLLRSQTLVLAGTRAGPSGLPIRVYRVPRAAPSSPAGAPPRLASVEGAGQE